MCSPETRISLVATARPWFAWVFLVCFGHFAAFLTAAPVYWDLNGNLAGSGSATPSGLWDLSSANWNPTPAGDTTDPVFWNNTGADTAVFSAGSDATGSYLVTVDGTIALSGVTVEESGTLTLAPQTTGGSLDFAAVLAQFNIASGATLVANVNLAGSAGLTKSGGGTLQLNGTVNPTGPYTVSAGTLAIGDGLTIGGTTLNLGGVAGASSTVSLGVGSVYNLGGAINFLNANTPLGGLIQGGTVQLNGNRTISVQNTSAVSTDLEISSVIADGSVSSSGITKTTGGALLLSGNNTFTGATTVSTGTLLVQGSAGSIAASTAISVAAGATLTIGATTDNVAVNRIGDDAIITLNGVQTNSGANININGADLATAGIHTEKIGSLVFAGDARSVLTLTAGSGDQFVLHLTSLQRQGNAAGLVRGANIGQASGTANAIRIMVDEPVALMGGGALKSQAAILPWLLSDPSTSGLGSKLVTYDTSRGLRPLDDDEYYQLPANNQDPITAGVNIWKFFSGAAAVNSSVRVNSWSTTQGGTVTLAAGVVLGIDSGAMLFTSGSTFTGGTLDLSSYSRGYLYMHFDGAITEIISSVLHGDSGLTVNAAGSGTKVVALGGNNTFTGGITVLQGIIELRAAGALNASGVNSLNLLSGTFRLNGWSATIAGLDGAGAIVNNSTANESNLIVDGGGTFTGTINDGASKALSLVKNGSDALILGDVNGYTGTTKVLGGVLHVNQNGNNGTNGRLTATSAIEVRQGGTLRINNGNSSNNNTNRINDAATITLGGGTLTFNTNAASGVVYSESVGSLLLEAGANQVTTQPSNANATSTFTFASLGGRTAGATLNFGGGSLGTSLNKVVFTAGVATGFVGGWATSGNEFVKYDATLGIVAMSGTDSLTTAATAWTATTHAKPAADQSLGASYDVASLNLAAGIDVNLNANTLAVVSGGFIKSGGTVDGTGTSISIISGAGKLTAGNTSAAAELFFRVTGANLRVNSVVDNNTAGGAVSVVKSGAGTVELNAANTYTGATYFNEGTILIDNTAALGVGGPLIFNGGKLKYGSGATAFDASTRTTLFLGDAIIDTQASDVTFTLAIGGNGVGRLIKAGAGTLNIASNTNAFNYQGITQVTEGTLKLTGTAASHVIKGLSLGGTAIAANVEIGSGNRLNVDGTITLNTSGSASTATIIGGTLGLSGDRIIQVGDSGSTNASNTLRIESTLDNGSSTVSRLVKTGSGTLLLTADNSYTGRTEVREGTLAVVDIEGLGQPASSEENVLVLGHVATSGTFSYRGAEAVSTSRAIALNSETGSGTLSSDGLGALEWNGAVTIAQTGTKTFVLGGSAAESVQNVLTSIISDNLNVQAVVNVVKSGTSTWRITGQNSYHGTTTVEAGALEVGASGDGTTLVQARTAGTTGTGRTFVKSGGILSGSGVIQTGLTLQGGDLRPGGTRPTAQGVTFAAGDKLGTLWVDGDFAFESGSLTFQVNTAIFNVSGLADSTGESYAATLAALPTSHTAALATPVNQGTDEHDKLVINGALTGTGAGTRTVNLLALEGATFLAGDVFNLMDWVNPLNQAAFNVDPTFVLPDISGSNLKWDTSLFAAQGILVVTSVPEPSRAILLITAIGLCVFRRRRAVQRL